MIFAARRPPEAFLSMTVCRCVRHNVSACGSCRVAEECLRVSLDLVSDDYRQVECLCNAS